MKYVEKSVEVNVPVQTAYNQWTQFEEFPRFMEGVESVKQMGDKDLYWRANLYGKVEEWNAVIQEQEPDKRISWRSTSGSENSGEITFQPLGANRTRVNVKMGYNPEGLVENVGAWLGIVGGRVEGDLKRFKEFIQARGQETGAWRGEIENEHVTAKG